MIGFGRNKETKTSSFWLDPYYFEPFEYSSKEERESGDLLKLASVRRSIANFVTIVTGKNIPVKFATKGMSATDGKHVVISADLTKFDTVCGLALHEASHIKLSNFSVLERMASNPESFFKDRWLKDMSIKYSRSKYQTAKLLIHRLKSLTNYIEDRRIDNFIYTTAPGYQGYYESMYDEYWNSPSIAEGLESAIMRDEVWESYEFRIINLTNPSTDLNALKGLKEIYKVINLKEISRLTDTKEVVEVALKVLLIIESYTSWAPQKEEEGEGEQGEGEQGEGEQGEGEQGEGEQGEGEQGEGEQGEGEGQKSEREDGDGEKDGTVSNPEMGESGVDKTSDRGTPQRELPLMTDKDVEKLMDAIEKQKKFLHGDIEQKELSDEKKEKVQSLEEAGTIQKDVAKGCSGLNKVGSSCPVIVMKNFNKQILDANPFGVFMSSPGYTEEVEKGFALGKLLGKKLQIRNEARTLKTTRLRTGKMDDRLIHSLGYGAEQVFERTFTDVFNPLHLHISIDASGSMGGRKWVQTMIAVTAIAKAASMVSNLNVVISFRYTGGGRYSDHNPVVLIAYDSRKDDIMKVKQLFPYLHAPSATPEGLCFEAMMELMVDGTTGQDSYFINFSDGEPFFSNKHISYSGDTARRHTRKMVEQMRGRGIKIMSYFIGGNGDSMDHFRMMYGKDAEEVDVTSLIPLAKTLNKLFVTK